MDSTDTPLNQDQTSTETAAPADPLETLAGLAEQAAQNPQTSAPVRELLPLLVDVIREQREELARHAAVIFELVG